MDAGQQRATVHPFILPFPFLGEEMEARSREMACLLPLSMLETEQGPGCGSRTVFLLL